MAIFFYLKEVFFANGLRISNAVYAAISMLASVSPKKCLERNNLVPVFQQQKSSWLHFRISNFSWLIVDEI